jgi:threonine dehydratase
METITPARVAAARERVAGHVRRTPVLAADPGTWFKLEYLQHAGSFKARGAFSRLVAADRAGYLDRSVGVVAASGGNHGLAVAYAAGRLRVPAQVWVPTNAPAVKVAALRSLGAEVVLHGDRYAEANEAATKRAADTGAVYCHAYDQPEVVAGQGTLGLELLDQLDGAVDTIVLAVGGGGLLAGVATAVAGHARVIAVEPATAPTLHAALAAGGPVEVPVGGVAADSLGASRVGEIAYAVAVATGVRSLLVDDADIVAARRLLWDRYRIAAEHAAGCALAALTTGAYRPEPGERVAVVICGANTDPASLTAPGPASG